VPPPNIATEAVVRASPDGHTLLLADASSTVNATLYEKLNFNFIRDIAPVAGIIRLANVLVVNPTFPARTVPEFIAYAKANPGKLNMASGGKGDPPHVSGELFKMMTGVDMAYVPYRGLAPALTDLLRGQVQVIFATMPSSIGFIRDNKLRALAVTTTTRSELLSDIPTLSEFLPTYEASQWYGVGAPKNTSAEIIERINKEINAGLADPRLKVRLTELGGAAMLGSAANFGKYIAEETEKWADQVCCHQGRMRQFLLLTPIRRAPQRRPSFFLLNDKIHAARRCLLSFLGASSLMPSFSFSSLMPVITSVSSGS
jgi:tripartite-type tricarboxylate transporter receptor subunit TctC